jgi:hypothetical protein
MAYSSPLNLGSPVIIPLTAISSNSRISWQKTLYQVSIALYLDNQISCLQSQTEALSTAKLVVKLTPFSDVLRSKFYNSLKSEAKDFSKQDIIALIVSLNVTFLKCSNIVDLRKGSPQSFNSSQGLQDETLWNADETVKQEILNHVNETFKVTVRQSLIELFAPLVPELAEELLIQMPKNEWQKTSTGLIPWKLNCPNTPDIDTEESGATFFLDDMYFSTAFGGGVSASKGQEMLGMILKQDLSTNVETAFSGFRHVVGSDGFKVLPQFKDSVNLREWMKKFSRLYPVEVKYLFERRWNLVNRLGL